MSFSKITDLRESAILRVLQHEVYADLAIKKKLSTSIIPKPATPFVYIDMADVRVEVFHINLSEKFTKKKFSSYKLREHKFVDIDEILSKKGKFLRLGVREALIAYRKMIAFEKKGLVYNPIIVKAGENFEIANGNNS